MFSHETDCVLGHVSILKDVATYTLAIAIPFVPS